MAIHKDPKGHEELKAVVGRRLKAARRAASLSDLDAAEALKHKGITQVSLAENGQRLPPLLDLIKYADLYCVPLDFLLGRINDPLSEPEEQGHAIIVRGVSQSIMGCFEIFTNAVAEHSAVCIAGHREDRQDIRIAVRAAHEVRDSLKRIKELNPDFEENLRGGSRLESAVGELIAIGARVEARVLNENRQIETIEKALKIEEIEGNVEQFRLKLA